MVKVNKFICYFIILTFLGLSACQNKEQVPAYICVDSFRVETDYSKQGTNSNDIRNYWLYVNNKLIGVFEYDSLKTIPVLATGEQRVAIYPGILENSSSTLHADYLMMKGYTFDAVLAEGMVYHFSPVFKYDNITFALLEDFDGEGNAFEVSEGSVPMKIYSGENAFERKCMHFSLKDSTEEFECKTVNLLTLPKNNNNCYLEINYRCNGVFSFGFFDKHSGSTGLVETRTSVFIFRSSGNEWRKVYVNLKTHLKDAQGYEIRPYFLCSKLNNDKDSNVEVYIDNVKILY